MENNVKNHEIINLLLKIEQYSDTVDDALQDFNNLEKAIIIKDADKIEELNSLPGALRRYVNRIRELL